MMNLDTPSFSHSPSRRNSSARKTSADDALFAATESYSTSLPPKQGLYDPAFERDACGVGFVARLDGAPTRETVAQGLRILTNLKHRGACGCDTHTGDGAGILTQIPHNFFARVCQEPQNFLDGGFSLPAAGEYGIGMIFFPALADERRKCEAVIAKRLQAEGLTVLGWRNPPINDQVAGAQARATQPAIRQIFVSAPGLTRERLEIKLYVARQMFSKEIARMGLRQGNYFYVASLSTRTICYKGLLQPEQLDSYYIDLKAHDFVSALALVHQRFSTNTFPSWALSHPFRYLAHNGEINTLRGNVNWMRAREAMLESPLFGEDIRKIKPIVMESGSDSAILDNVVELLVLSGRTLPHALMMLSPEAWESKADMSEELRAFYQYHCTLFEPWDGPAAISFTDGSLIGTALDRNGLRPARFVVTADGVVAMASEAGALEFSPETIVRKGRVEPGSMIIVDLESRRIIENDEIKSAVAARQPYAEYVKSHLLRLEEIPAPAIERETLPNLANSAILLQQLCAFGYSDEDVNTILRPMAQTGEEPVGSMGNDTPLAVLSERPQQLSNYFKQLFAQVTNPPIDPLRESSVMSLRMYTGRRGKFLNEEYDPLRCDLELDSPVITDEELAKIMSLDGSNFTNEKNALDFPSQAMTSAKLSTLYPIEKSVEGLVKALTNLCEQAEAIIEEGHSILILSDRGVSETMAAIPALLAVSAVHHHLIKVGKRTQVGLIVESGEPREVMHFALLIGYGASAVNPYLALATIRHAFAASGAMATVHGAKLLAMGSAAAMTENYRKAIGKGLLKIMSKMGISTLMSYRGAQIFEAIGLSSQLIDNYFPRTPSRLEGVDLRHIARDIERFHKAAFASGRGAKTALLRSGLYKWQRDGEFHAYNPATIHALQRATRENDYEEFKRYSALVNGGQKKQVMLRNLLEWKNANPIPLSEVEPVEAIMRRFATGAMSFGSISAEAHETLAIAMNSIGGKSNTGEGGEDEARFADNRRSSIKQIASGRFGVTSHYLVNADELQIKVAQGAKPGEGGQLPGHKVDAAIARVRHSVPGVTLISPPPHHDIYSIEDLAQLIYDLKNVNPHAAISVKLVAEVGVGVVAAGVAKAHADLIVISGYDGGTGASPISSTRHAGVPWELGLAETQQTLVLNDLRSRVRLQVDGQLKTGRDVVVAALLGAEEFGFSTAPLVVSGCILMRKCHLNTCPVGVATQKPELREKFTGKVEHIVNFFRFIAEEVREIMAQLGFRTMDEMIGRASDYLRPASDLAGKAATLDLSALLHQPTKSASAPLRCTTAQDHGLSAALDRALMKKAAPALQDASAVEFSINVKNVHRTIGAMLGGEISRRFGARGLPEDTIRILCSGTAGQSFGAFIPRGLTLRLEGEANDYVGKGLSGGKIIVVPPDGATFAAEDNVIAGNTILYGATSGEIYIRGQVGERFAVRNSGAIAVVEGVGDHACEYMTGGVVVVLGQTGRNFAAGMSGGLAFVYDPRKTFALRCNHKMVDVVNILDDEQNQTLYDLLQRHIGYTNSAIARRIVDSWSAAVQDFALVFPHEYRKYLQQKRRPSVSVLATLSEQG